MYALFKWPLHSAMCPIDEDVGSELLCNKLSQAQQLQNTHLLSCSFCGQESGHCLAGSSAQSFMSFQSVSQAASSIGGLSREDSVSKFTILFPKDSTTKIYCFIGLEARHPKSRCWQSHIPSETCRRKPLFASSSFWCLLAILSIPWFVNASLQFLPLSSDGHLLPVHFSSSLVHTSVISN